MAQIITYPKLSTLANDDLLLVSDVSSVNKTTNSLEIDTLAQHIIITNNVIKGGGTLNYVPIFTPTGTEIGDSQLQQSPPNAFGMYQMRFNNADRFIINKPSSVTAGDPEYLIQQDGNYKVSFGWDDDGGGFGFIYNWAGNGLKLGAQGQNPQFELNTAIPKIISHTAHEFSDTIEVNGEATFYDNILLDGGIRDNSGNYGALGQVLSSTGAGVEWISGGGGTVTGTGTTNTLPVWSDGPNGVLGDSILSQNAGVNSEAFLNGKLIGTGGDFYIESQTDDIIIRTTANDKDVFIQSDNGSGAIATYFQADGSTGAVRLFHYGTKKLETTSNGVDLYGEVTFDDYGSGTVTGTATRSLAVDANGKVIEEPLPSGSTTILINGLVNNLASAGSGGYDFMEWVSNVTSATQIPVMKTPRDMVLKSVSYSWMGDTALSIGVGEQVAFTIGTIPSGVNPVIANYTSAVSLFDLTNADDGTYANDVVTGLNQAFSVGDVIAVVGQETGTVTPNSGELSLCFEFEIS